MAWDGHYQLYMFHKTPQSKGLVKVPENLQNLLNDEDEPISEFAQNLDESAAEFSLDETKLCKNDSILDLIDGQVEHERPFSDDELDPMIDDFAEDVVWNNTEWRNRLERKLKKKIQDSEDYNLSIKNDPKKKFFREREVDPYWLYLLKEIEYTNAHEQVKAANNEIAEKDDGLYTEKEELMQKDHEESQVDTGSETSESNVHDVSEGDTVESDLHNQGLVEIDSKDLEETEIAESSLVTRDMELHSDTESHSAKNRKVTRDDTSETDEDESSEDDQIVVITGHEIAENLQVGLQNEREERSLNRRFDHLQFKARLKMFADREPLKIIENNKKSNI